MKRSIIILLLVINAAGLLQAQQYLPRTQFYENRIMYNPAVAGSEKEIPIALNFRRQWTGMEDSPSAEVISSHAYSGRQVGLGLSIYNDVTGPARNTGIQAAVARHFPLGRNTDYFFTFGMSLLLYQFKFDTDRLRTYQPNDPAVQALANQNSKITPDLGVGFYISNEKSFIGISCINLVQNKSEIFSPITNSNTINRNYYLMAGYNFPVSDKLSLEPLLLSKINETLVWQTDIMVKAHLGNSWTGLAYRTGDAIAVLAGIHIDMFSFGYSYDFSVGPIGSYNTGSHEITVIGYLFDAVTRYGEHQKGVNSRYMRYKWKRRKK